MKYTRLTRSVYSKGILVPTDDVLNHVEDINLDWYASLYTYTEEQYQDFKKTGSVKGVKDVTTRKLWWDFDDKENPDNSRKSALTLVSRLEKLNIPTKDIEIYFSGNKGFNVLLNVDKELTREQVEAFCLGDVAKDLPGLDFSMYDHTQILRVPGTRHQESKLFKIPITKETLEKSVSIIKEQAISLDNIKDEFSWNVVSLDAKHFEVEKKVISVISDDVSKTFNPSSTPKGWKAYKWALAEGYFEAGERHQALMIVAATCRGLGYDRDTAYYICKAALKKQAARSGKDEFPKEELYNNIIDSVYSPDWSGGQYSYKNNVWLKMYAERMNLVPKEDEDLKILQIGDLTNDFIHHVENLDEDTIKTGIDVLDEGVPLTVGMNLGLLGGPGSGKTAIALKILENTSKNGVLSVMASLDMQRNRLYLKLLMKESGLSRNEVYKLFKDKKHEAVIAKIKDKYKNVWFYDRSSPSVDDIRRYIDKVEENTGRKVKLLMVDYFERINSERTEDTAASKDVAGKLQDLLNDKNLCIITLVQPNKFSLSAGPDTPILSYTAIKGSSFLYQAFRSIISIWRPFYTPELKAHDKFLQMAILKNDLGELDMFNFGWEGKTGDIWDLSEEEQDELERLLDEKNSKGKEKQDGGWS